MKKEYVNPEMEVVMLNTMPLLAGSGEETAGFGEGTKPTSGACASEFFDNGGSEDW